ncbi:hypothetical protein AV530_011740 [Patagioenas fasciata monilis]|uniref:Uncharacterized protein n=1 Tax=Patagioenas fasciata monilis TaxID=372326 RepID=A0A1V4KLG1_PATFA|nr:hypothetical protein AV530_011740 [Patagioenas fasciata monilis]
MPAGDRHELILLFHIHSEFLTATDHFASSSTKTILTNTPRVFQNVSFDTIFSCCHTKSWFVSVPEERLIAKTMSRHCLGRVKENLSSLLLTRNIFAEPPSLCPCSLCSPGKDIDGHTSSAT